MIVKENERTDALTPQPPLPVEAGEQDAAAQVMNVPTAMLTQQERLALFDAALGELQQRFGVLVAIIQEGNGFRLQAPTLGLVVVEDWTPKAE